MGSGFARALSRTVNGTGEGTPWARSERGPQLRKFFGAYTHGDIWAVYRRLRQVDATNCGYLTFDELQQVIRLAEFQLIFIWDIFSRQNEFIEVKELLTMLAVFSSARLVEKGRFLMTIFDASQTGMCTGAEVAELCTSVLGVLARCTSCVTKPKEVAADLRDDLIRLLSEYREAAKRGSPESTFNGARVIAHSELEKLLPPIRSKYEELPMAGAPPADSPAPPPPDWSITSEPTNSSVTLQAAERVATAAPLPRAPEPLPAALSAPGFTASPTSCVAASVLQSPSPSRSTRSASRSRKREVVPLDLGGGLRPIGCDRSTQATDLSYTLEEVMQQIVAEKLRIRTAELARDVAWEAVRQREAMLAEWDQMMVSEDLGGLMDSLRRTQEQQRLEQLKQMAQDQAELPESDDADAEEERDADEAEEARPKRVACSRMARRWGRRRITPESSLLAAGPRQNCAGGIKHLRSVLFGR